MKKFVNREDNKNNDLIATSEICITYHTLNHHLFKTFPKAIYGIKDC